MDFKTVIQKVNGLNSPTTLKRWRKMAEDLVGATFKKDSGNIYHFTPEDIVNFQKVADTKAEKGLESAILHAFSKGREPPLSLNERISLLENHITDLQKETISQNKQNQSLIANYNYRLNRLYERVDLIEEQPKIKKLLSKKY